MGLWLVLVAACVLGGSAAGVHSLTEADLRFGESGHARQLMADGGLQPPETENVLITAPSGPLPGNAAAAADAVAADLRGLAGVSAVAGPTPAPDGSALLVTATVTPGADPGAAVAQVADASARANPGLRVERVSGAAVGDGVTEQLGRDFATAEVTSVPVTLVILLVAFGALVAAGLPLLLALSSVAAAIGLEALASHVFPHADTTTNMILLMGMAVGVDYSLFYLKRERAERARGAGTVDAIELAAATSGHSVLVSGMAVCVAMAGLYLERDATFTSLATGSILVVAVSMVGSLTVLPAMLAKFGRAVDRPRVPLLWRLSRAPGRSRVWSALLAPALRRPLVALLAAVAALLAMAAPALGLKLRESGPEGLPATIPAVQAWHRLTAAFPSEGQTYVVVAHASGTGSTTGLSAALAQLGGGGEISADGRTRTVTVPAMTGDDSELAALRARTSSVLGALPAVTFAVGGDPAESLDYAAHQRSRLPWVVGFVLVLTFVVVAFSFRSLIAAVLAVAVNLLSAGAAFGVLVAVFQRHWATGLLGFTSTGTIVSWIPLFTFVVLFGLSMDYHIFVVSRIREAAARGLPTRAAVATGIQETAGVVTSAAAVMVAVFAIFASLSILEFKEIGVGLAVAVLVDALVVRILILPAAMSLLGKANWWPGRLTDRTRPTVRAEGGPLGASVAAAAPAVRSLGPTELARRPGEPR